MATEGANNSNTASASSGMPAEPAENGSSARNGHKFRGGHDGKRRKWERSQEKNGPSKDNRPTKRRWLEGDRGGKAGGGSSRRDEIARRAEGQLGPLRQSKMSIQFSAEEIAAEARRPKRKVAVLMGYAGTGYRGMQINHDEKTIEGDLFAALVGAGAIAKTNADDPKKSSFVRCARTDKGVHAAGNVVSLKMIVEDADIVERINTLLPPQIRIWGIIRTVNSFSCYQACDSRWYEYLLPSYALLPPHPQSFLGREMAAWASKAGPDTLAAMQQRLADVETFWADVERNVVQPLIDRLDPDVRAAVLAQLHSGDGRQVGHRGLDSLEETLVSGAAGEPKAETIPKSATEEQQQPPQEQQPEDGAASDQPKTPVELALREIKAAYVAAKRRYRVTPERLQQLQEALSCYVGTKNYHNYTVQKQFHDASAKRHIKSFLANPEPIQIRDTQWLSLRVHGQSFMMHQIRKMVAMAVMLVRCGNEPGPAMEQSFGPRRISIPRAPGLGLLLERPVFDSYNGRVQENTDKTPLNFDLHETAIREFKDREIYSRIWDVEESQNIFHAFFQQLDNFHTSYYYWAIPGGYDAAFERFGRAEQPKAAEDDSDEDAEDAEGGEG